MGSITEQVLQALRFSHLSGRAGGRRRPRRRLRLRHGVQRQSADCGPARAAPGRASPMKPATLDRREFVALPAHRPRRSPGDRRARLADLRRRGLRGSSAQFLHLERDGLRRHGGPRTRVGAAGPPRGRDHRRRRSVDGRRQPRDHRRQAAENLAIVVLDNAHYGATGMQPSHTKAGVDLATVAKGCRFRRVAEVSELERAAEMRALLHNSGARPSFWRASRPTIHRASTESRRPRDQYQFMQASAKPA